MRRRIGTLALGLLVATTTVHAQQGDRKTRVGVGVSLNPASLLVFDDDGPGFFLPGGLANFYVPILAGQRLRIEPEVGIVRTHSEFSDVNVSGERTFTSLRLGVGVHMALRPAAALRPYLGPRFGIIRQTGTQR